MQDDGTSGTPIHPNCPCIGDYPHIGADAHGFYVTTNEYPFFAPGEFNGAQIYAFDKRALARGAPDVYVTQFDTTGLPTRATARLHRLAGAVAAEPRLRDAPRRHRVLPVLDAGRGGTGTVGHGNQILVLSADEHQPLDSNPALSLVDTPVTSARTSCRRRPRRSPGRRRSATA